MPVDDGAGPRRYGAPPYLPGAARIGENPAMAKKRARRPEGFSTPAPQPRRSATPARAPQPSLPATSRRARFERWSRPWLLRMQLLPNFVIPAILGVMLFLGLALPWAWAGLLLVAIAVFMFWLTAVSWPVISPGSRALRMVVNVGILALGVARLLGWL